MTKNLEDYQTLKQFLYQAFQDLVNKKNAQAAIDSAATREGEDDEKTQEDKIDIDDDMGYDE